MRYSVWQRNYVFRLARSFTVVLTYTAIFKNYKNFLNSIVFDLITVYLLQEQQLKYIIGQVHSQDTSAPFIIKIPQNWNKEQVFIKLLASFIFQHFEIFIRLFKTLQLTKDFVLNKKNSKSKHVSKLYTILIFTFCTNFIPLFLYVDYRLSQIMALIDNRLRVLHYKTNKLNARDRH